jgi:SAM-dependent MidA family methyltransferase
MSAIRRPRCSRVARTAWIAAKQPITFSCGLAVLVSAGDPTMTLSRLKGTSAVHRLIGPWEMGELFKVLTFGKGIEESILGFQSARHLQM